MPEGAGVKNMNFNETYMKDLLKQWGKHVVALILFLGLVMTYFSPAVFDGKVIMQGDNIKATGMGSSQMIKMKINKVFKRLGIDAEIGHMSVGEAKGVANNYDMIFVSETFTSQFRTGKDTKVIGLKNLLSEKEIEAKIREALDMPAE